VAEDAPKPDHDTAQPKEATDAAAEWLAEIEASPFARCATCRHSSEVNIAQGVLLCGRHNMHVNAEADEIPDDCPDYERDPSRPLPADPTAAAGPSGGDGSAPTA
jgi:hypothetical protein